MSKQSKKLGPALAAVLCLCPALAGAETAGSGLALGVSIAAVYAVSEGLLYLLRDWIAPRARLPLLLVVSAGLAALLEVLMEVYAPSLYEPLALYLPLSALNCVLLDWAETARGGVSRSRKTTLGVGFVLALGALGLLREFLGAGTLFGAQVLPADLPPMAALSAVPGAFLLAAFLAMGANALSGTDGEEGAK